MQHWSKDPIRRKIVTDKISKSISGKNHPAYGKHFTKEHKEKLSESQLGISVPARGDGNRDRPKTKVEIKRMKKTFKNRGKDFLSERARKTHTPESDEKRRKSMAEHKQKILEVAKKYKDLGYEVITEFDLRPDLIIRKDGKLKAVEVQRGGSKPNNYHKQNIFDEVIWESF